MNRRGLIGAMCVWAASPGMSFSGEALPDGTPLRVLMPPNTSWEEPLSSGGVATQGAIRAAHAELIAALEANDIPRLMALYRDDARSLPDQQPRLLGKAQIAAWHEGVQARRRITAYRPAIREVFDFGDTLLEYGGFSTSWRLTDDSTQTAQGKYLHVWARQPDGSLRLQADVRNWVEPLKTPADFFVALPAIAVPAPADNALGAELKILNDRNAAAVKGHDGETRIAVYADDAIIMPINVTPKVGMTEIRPFLTQYVDNGRGATFDKVAVWNEGFEDLSHGYVLEYFKFHVDWRAGSDGGTVSGGGIRLWRRGADGALKMLREIGTHDLR